MIGKGKFEFDKDGQKFGFRFGTYAAAVTEKENGGKKITTIFDEMREKGASASFLLDFFFGGAVYWAELRGEKHPTKAVVSDWLEILGEVEAARVFNEAVLGPKVDGKNLPAPGTGQPTE